MTDLKVARDLTLPAEVAGEAIAILGKRGAGKTNTSIVLVEEMLDAKIQVVVLDPVGAWWGLRNRYAIPMLGGAHGDLPLEPTAGKLLAEVVVESGQSIVLDTSAFTSKAQVARFVTDFLDTLYRLLASNPHLIHVVLEEADEFAPQKPYKEETRMLSAVEQAVRRGRGRGLGLTMVSQRAAVLNKNVLEQADVLVAMRVTGPNDRKAIDAWVGKHDAGGEIVEVNDSRSPRLQSEKLVLPTKGSEVIRSLPTLETGQAWFWNPERNLLQLVTVRPRKTLDVSGRIKQGQKTATVKLKPIDLNLLGTRIAETVEKQKDNDPKELHKTIRELRAELAKGERAPAAVETIEVEVPVISDEHLKTLRGELTQFREDLGALAKFGDYLVEVVRPLEQALEKTTGARAPVTAGAAASASGRRTVLQDGDKPPALREGSPAAPTASTATETLTGVSRPQQRILDALAWFDAIGAPKPKRSILAPMADTTSKSSGFEKNLSTLRTGGLIDYGAGSTVYLTGAGAAAANTPDRPGTVDELQEAVISKVSGPQGRILRVLIAAGGQAVSRDELAEAAETTVSSSGFEKNLSTLKTLGVIDYPARGYVCALPILFLEQ